MYGLINTAFEDLALAGGGPDCWDAIRAKAGVELPSFLTTECYPDEMTFRLVSAASAVLGRTEEEMLRDFGRHWVRHTTQKGYGPLMRLCGADFRSFLKNLDALHTRVGASMPDMRPPSFVLDDSDEACWRLHYYSERTGLAPMVLGLIDGLAEMFDFAVRIEHEPRTGEDQDHDVFRIEPLA